MRQWINLFENKPITAQDLEAFIASPTIEHGVDFLEDDIDEHGIEEIVRWANDFQNHHGPIAVFRGLWVPNARDLSSVWLNNVGASWSPDLHHAINEHGPDGSFGRHHEGMGKFTNLVLCGTVSHDDVDWLASFAIRRQDGEEAELRLKRGTVVEIHQTVVFDQSAYDMPDDTHTQKSGETIMVNLKATI